MPAEAEKAGPSYAECVAKLTDDLSIAEEAGVSEQFTYLALALDCVRAMQMLAEGKAGPASRSHNEGEFYAFTKTERAVRFASTPHAAILSAGDDPK